MQPIHVISSLCNRLVFSIIWKGLDIDLGLLLLLSDTLNYTTQGTTLCDASYNYENAEYRQEVP